MLLPACKLKGLAQFRLLAAKVFTVGNTMPPGGRRYDLSLHEQRKRTQDGAMLHMAVIKHHGHVADRAALVDSPLRSCMMRSSKEVVLDYSTAVECDAVADLHEVEFGEQAGGDKVVTANPASKAAATAKRSKGCSETPG